MLVAGTLGYTVAASRMGALKRAAPAGGPTVAGPPPRIVLVSLDSFRARSASFDQPAGVLAGFSDLARDSTVFTNCRATGERTQVAMMTVLTGVRPHRVFTHVHNALGYVQEGSIPGLAGHLAAAGYRSRWVTMKIAPDLLGFSGEFVEGRRHNQTLPANQFNVEAVLPVQEVSELWFARLLRHADPMQAGIANDVLATRESFRQAKAYLDAKPGRSFVWVHIGAPHLPYYDVPEQDLGGRLRPDAYRQVTYNGLRYARPEQIPHIERVYERYSRFVEAEFGLLLSQLRHDGQWEETLLIVVSDHGEEQRAGSMGHGTRTLAEDVTHVPLVIHRPRQAAPERIEALVGHEDVLPTVLAQVSPQRPAGLEGVNLFAGTPPARTLYSWGRYEHYTAREFPGDEIAAYDGRFKYVRDFTSGREGLFDLSRDPRAAHDVSRRHATELAALRERSARGMVP